MLLYEFLSSKVRIICMSSIGSKVTNLILSIGLALMATSYSVGDTGIMLYARTGATDYVTVKVLMTVPSS